jgi:secondary thiamine-phosphate synthase enzyme
VVRGGPEPLTPLAFWGPVEVPVPTSAATELVDVTEVVAGAVAGSGVDRGCVQVFCPHTSCGLAVTELEDGLHADLRSLLDELAPPDRAYRHDDLARRTQNLEPDERPNGWSHLRALLVTQPSVVLPVGGGGRLQLGRWQRLFLVELDGPRAGRRLHVQAWGAAAGPAAGPAPA